MKTVVIAAGHSNTDSGAVNGEHKESVLMASFRNAVAVYLRSNGIRVVTDGTGLVNKPLKESISLIKGSDLAVEFHMNAATSKQ
ncbi:MAG: N-acetylmuramoyl-L-alanine amidase, partial [Christensenellaceae bacterium]